jgi:hypothetical protein
MIYLEILDWMTFSHPEPTERAEFLFFLLESFSFLVELARRKSRKGKKIGRRDETRSAAIHNTDAFPSSSREHLFFFIFLFLLFS